MHISVPVLYFKQLLRKIVQKSLKLNILLAKKSVLYYILLKISMVSVGNPFVKVDS